MIRRYISCGDRGVNLLATKDELISRLRHEWALYPDHVVFLGPNEAVLEKNFKTYELDKCAISEAPLLFQQAMAFMSV